MGLSRREFLQTSGLGILSGMTLLRAPLAFAANPELAFTHDMVSGFRPTGGLSFVVRRTSFDTGEFTDIPLSFEPHAFVQHPQMPERVWVVQNFGENAAEIDFSTGKITRQITLPSQEHSFMGHGFFTPDAKKFCVTCMDEKSGEGHFAVYETENFQQQDFIKVTPGNLHHCILQPDKTVYITSLGRKEGEKRKEAEAEERSSLVHVGLDGKIIDKKFLESDVHSIGHFGVMANGTIVAVTRTVGGKEDIAGSAFVSDKGTAPFKEIAWPKTLQSKFKGSMLGIGFDEANHVAAISNPSGGLMMFLDTRDWNVLGHVKKTAKGIEFLPATCEFLCSGADEFRVSSLQRGDRNYPVTAIAGTDGFHNQHNLLVPKLGG